MSGWLDRGGGHPPAARWRQGAQAAGFGSVTALDNAAFGPATLRHRQEGGHGLFAGAREVVDTLRADGVELVIVSNSEPAKLVAPFDAAGIERKVPGLVSRYGRVRKARLARERRGVAHVLLITRAGDRTLLPDHPQLPVGERRWNGGRLIRAGRLRRRNGDSDADLRFQLLRSASVPGLHNRHRSHDAGPDELEVLERRGVQDPLHRIVDGAIERHQSHLRVRINDVPKGSERTARRLEHPVALHESFAVVGRQTVSPTLALRKQNLFGFLRQAAGASLGFCGTPGLGS